MKSSLRTRQIWTLTWTPTPPEVRPSALPPKRIAAELLVTVLSWERGELVESAYQVATSAFPGPTANVRSRRSSVNQFSGGSPVVGDSHHAAVGSLARGPYAASPAHARSERATIGGGGRGRDLPTGPLRGIAPALDRERAWPSDAPGCGPPLPGAEPARDRAALCPVAAGAGGRGPRPGATRGAERPAVNRSRARNGHVPPGATPAACHSRCADWRSDRDLRHAPAAGRRSTP